MESFGGAVAVNGSDPDTAGRIRADLIPAVTSGHLLGRDPDFVFRPLPQIEENGRLGPILTKDLSEKGHGLTQNLLGDEGQKKACALLFCFKPYKSTNADPGAKDGGPFD